MDSGGSVDVDAVLASGPSGRLKMSAPAGCPEVKSSDFLGWSFPSVSRGYEDRECLDDDPTVLSGCEVEKGA